MIIKVKTLVFCENFTWRRSRNDDVAVTRFVVVFVLLGFL